MTQISKLTAVDPRTPWGKISRRQYWRGAKRLNIPFKAGATQDEMIAVCQAAGVTPDQIVNFVPVTHPTDAKGGEVTVMQPESHERVYDEQKEHRRMELFEQRIEDAVEAEKKLQAEAKAKVEAEKDSEISILKSELEDMKTMMARLLENTESKPVKKITDPKETDPYKMKFMAQRKWLKGHGVELKTGEKAAPLIDKVLANGENAA